MTARADVLVVGLGNPGPEYAATRHNVGFWVVEAFADRHRLPWRGRRFRGRFAEGEVAGRRVALLLPLTFMNASGEAVGPAVRGLGLTPAQVVVVSDDMDLPLGRIRLRPKGSSGGHNGLRSVAEALGTDGFPRLRVGIGRPAPGVDPVDHVLGPFAPAEQEAVARAVDRAVEALACLVACGIEAAMTRFNGTAMPEGAGGGSPPPA